MIHVHTDPLLFELHTRNSVYACGVTDRQRLEFRTWCGKPETLTEPLFSKDPGFKLRECAAQDSDKPVDEILGYGDECLREPSISISIPESGLDPEDGANLPVRDLRLRYGAHRIGQPSLERAGQPHHERPTAEADGGDWLVIELEDEHYPFAVELCLRPHATSDVIERRIVLLNRGDQTVTVVHAHAASLSFPVGAYRMTHLCGGWGAEFQRQSHDLPIGATVIESRALISGARHQPTVLLQRRGRATRTGGETFGAQLAWSGNWRIHAEQRHDQSLRVHLGEHPVDAALQMEPGAQHATPLVLCTRSEAGEEGASRNFHAYHRALTLPRHEGPRPVLYNSWEATYFNLSTENQIELAKRAAAIGCELFVVDDGWFGGRRNEDAGLGDWTVSAEVFPEGLGPLIETVHDLGMKFGIWFEPEMVNPDSDLYRAHPDWVLHFPKRERSTARYQLILDFGNPEVAAHIESQMTAFLDAHEVDFIKWDMNRTPKPPGSVAGQRLWRAHVDAVHGIMDRLLKRYPRLTIQSCSSGGGRADAGMLARCVQVWTSDNTDALQRAPIQEGYVLGYPPETMECWVTHEMNHQSHNRHSLDLRFAMAMRGVLGIGSSLDALRDEELAAYKKWIAHYKTVRPLVQGGRLHRAALPEIDNGLSAWQFTATDGSEAYLSIIVTQHQPGQTFPHLKLKDLDAEARYRITDLANEAEPLVLSGNELLHAGFQALPTLPGQPIALVGYTRHLLLRRVE